MLDANNNPFNNPAAWDRFKLDGIAHPGLSELQSGGERKDKIEGQQGYGDEGAFTVIRGTEIGALTYEIAVWTPEHLTQLGVWLDMLRQARKKRPRKVWEHQDHRTDHTEITRTILESIGPLKKKSPGLWGVVVSFKEWKKRKVVAGPVRGKSETQKLAEAAKADAEVAKAEFEKIKAQVFKGG